jgi:hypothetical protein
VQCQKKVSISLTFRENVIYDGDIIIILEGLENFLDPETKKESSLKFWLPKTFPDNVRVIVTASPTSKSAAYMKDLGCYTLPILAEKTVIQSWLDNAYSKKKQYLVDENHLKKLTQFIGSRIENDSVKMIYVKGIMGLLAPMSYPQIENEHSEKELLKGWFNRLNWTKLESKEG